MSVRSEAQSDNNVLKHSLLPHRHSANDTKCTGWASTIHFKQLANTTDIQREGGEPIKPLTNFLQISVETINFILNGCSQNCSVKMYLAHHVQKMNYPTTNKQQQSVCEMTAQIQHKVINNYYGVA